MKCSKCGVSNSNAASLCSSCGAPLIPLNMEIRSQEASSRQAAPPKRGPGKGKKVFASYALIVVAVLIVAGASMVYDSNGDSSGSIPINLPSVISSNNSSSQPQMKAQADASPSGIVHSTASKTNHTIPQTSNSTNPSTPPSNDTPPPNNTTSSNNASGNETLPGNQSSSSAKNNNRKS